MSETETYVLRHNIFRIGCSIFMTMSICYLYHLPVHSADKTPSSRPQLVLNIPGTRNPSWLSQLTIYSW